MARYMQEQFGNLPQGMGSGAGPSGVGALMDMYSTPRRNLPRAPGMGPTDFGGGGPGEPGDPGMNMPGLLGGPNSLRPGLFEWMAQQGVPAAMIEMARNDPSQMARWFDQYQQATSGASRDQSAPGPGFSAAGGGDMGQGESATDRRMHKKKGDLGYVEYGGNNAIAPGRPGW